MKIRSVPFPVHPCFNRRYQFVSLYRFKNEVDRLIAGMYRERNGTDFHRKLWPGTVRNGTDDVSERNGREWNGTDFFLERNGTERNEQIFVLDGAERNATPKC